MTAVEIHEAEREDSPAENEVRIRELHASLTESFRVNARIADLETTVRDTARELSEIADGINTNIAGGVRLALALLQMRNRLSRTVAR